MTAVASGLQRDVEYGIDMAIGAFERLVRAVNLVIRVGVVIKPDKRPVAAHVAGIAGGTQEPIVIIVVEVAGNAGHVEFISERVFAVTVAATKLGM